LGEGGWKGGRMSKGVIFLSVIWVAYIVTYGHIVKASFIKQLGSPNGR